mgnify:CR=1 FL=1
MILEVIKNRPGISYNEIARRTKLSNGVVSHHILKLMDGGKILKYGKGRPRYFRSETSEKDMQLVAYFHNKTHLKIIQLLIDMKTPLKIETISKSIGKSNSTVSISLKKMLSMNLITREILNKNSNLTSDIGYKISDAKFVNELISKYNLY